MKKLNFSINLSKKKFLTSNKMLQSFLNILGDLQTKSVNPYDNDYPQYRLPTSLNQERVEHSKSSELDSNKERAFSIANKVIYAICSNNLKEANEMSFH